MHRLSSQIPGVFFGCVCAAASGRAEVELVRDGIARSVIVIPEKATAVVRLAAEEFRDHVRLSTGAELAIVNAADAAAKSWPAGFATVYVGESVAGRARGVTAAGLELEHYRVRAVADELHFVGADGAKARPGADGDPLNLMETQPGTLFAVYHFLDRELGVRWLWPGDLGTHAPKRATIVVGDLNVRDGPRLWQRKFRTPKLTVLQRRTKVHKGTDLPVHPTDPKLAAETAREDALWHRRHFMGRRGEPRFGHSFTRWWGRHGRAHPEWFALRPDGERGLKGMNPAAVKFCVGNPEVADAVVEDWKRQGAPRFLRACPNDGRGYCVCDKCRAMDVPPMQPAEKIDGMQKADRYVKFWNALYRRAVKVNPDVVLCSYAYQDYREPPKQTRLEANVILGYVGSQSSLPDPEAAGLYAQWKGWSDAGAQLFFRPNWLFIGHAVPYMPLHESARVMRFLHRNNLLGTDFDGFHHQYAVKGPLYYLLARLHTRPELDADEIIGEFCSAFGGASHAIADYIRYWEAFSSDSENKAGAGNIALKYTPEVQAQAHRILDRATAALGPEEETERRRVAFLRAGLEHVRLMANVNGLRAAGISTETMREGIRAAFDLHRFRLAHAADHVTHAAGITSRELKRGDPLMQRLISVFGGREPVDVLPERWSFRWDPEMRGEEQKWYREGLDPVKSSWSEASVLMAWEHQDVGKEWKEKHGSDYDGLAWYRTNFTVPEAERGKHISLLFAALDETGRIWVNGRHVGDHANLNKMDWKSPFECEISKHVRFGAENVVTVLVEDRAGLGGIWQPVYLMGE